jgi:endonuclease/exonuclease/phosphatase family metal-dependent hydrolase
MATKFGFFNVNNLFLRYKFSRRYPGDISGKSYISEPNWGFLPLYNKGAFVPFKPEQSELCAAALSTQDLPDVLCFCEVESLLALRAFNERHLGKHYTYALLVDGRDLRQIDVGLLSNKEILEVRTHVDDLDSEGKPLFSRDCLEVVIALNKSGSQRLTLFINHLKSEFIERKNKTEEQIKAKIEKANQRRLTQAEAVRTIVRKRFPGNSYGEELFMVVGDLNDQPDSPWVRPIVREADLYNVIDELPEEERWTYWWKSKNRASQIDYLLLSPALTDLVASHNIKPTIERRGIGIKGFYASGNISPRTTRIFRTDDDANPKRVGFEFKRFDEVLDTKQHASDHCPVFLDIP